MLTLEEATPNQINRLFSSKISLSFQSQKPEPISLLPKPQNSMVGTSLDTTGRHLAAATATTTIKFLCSYGGKIIPRYPDGKLRYHGGETRVLAVDRSISFSELLLKLGELSGTRVSLRCQLPKEDLDALVSITSDEDLANLIEEYDRAAIPKIRAFLSMPKKISPPPSSPSSTTTSSSSSSPSNSYAATIGSTASTSKPRCYHQISKPVVYPVKKILPPAYYYGYHGNSSYACMVHNGNHWQ